MFRANIPIRFGDEDHAGIVYFPRFLDFFHCAFEDFFAANGRPYKLVLDEDLIGWPAVHVDVDFLSPLRFGDMFEVDVWVEKIGTKSATFGYLGRANDKDVAKAQIVVACIDMRAFKGVPIPTFYREMFEAHLVTDGSSSS